MGLYSHSTHLFVPDKEHARVLAGAMLKSAHSLVLSTPYSHWINVYLPMGLSYKDVPELPTATHLELNCYNSEGFDFRLYTQDRLAFMFESGCGDVSEQEDELLIIAEKLWRDDPNRPKAEVSFSAAEAAGDEAADIARAKEKEPSFWDLPAKAQEDYVAKARATSDFRRYVEQATNTEDNMPEVEMLEQFLPAGRSAVDLQVMLAAASKRLFGPPSDEREKVILERYMNGKNHSPRAEDYVAAIAAFLELKGALWSLETIQQQKGDKIDRRIIKLDELLEAPRETAS